jgi:hypothetical protein
VIGRFLRKHPLTDLRLHHSRLMLFGESSLPEQSAHGSFSCIPFPKFTFQYLVFFYTWGTYVMQADSTRKYYWRCHYDRSVRGAPIPHQVPLLHHLKKMINNKLAIYMVRIVNVNLHSSCTPPFLSSHVRLRQINVGTEIFYIAVTPKHSLL